MTQQYLHILNRNACIRMCNKDMYKDVHSSIFRYSPKLEATHMSIISRMDKSVVMYVCNGKLHCNENERTATGNRMNLTNTMLAKEARHKRMQTV